jgi:hypothetical protein
MTGRTIPSGKMRPNASPILRRIGFKPSIYTLKINVILEKKILIPSSKLEITA